MCVKQVFPILQSRDDEQPTPPCTETPGGGDARALAPTHRGEAVVEGDGVQQGPGLPCLLQGGQHHLAPQGRVQTHQVLDVAEHLGGVHLRQQAALLQVEEAAQEQLPGRERERERERERKNQYE